MAAAIPTKKTMRSAYRPVGTSRRTVRMGPRYWAGPPSQLWIGAVDAICRDRQVPAWAGNVEPAGPEITVCMTRRQGHAICISFGRRPGSRVTLTPSIPASIVDGRARSDPGLDPCPPTAGRLAVPPEDRATGDEQDRATPSRPGYSGLACGPGATHPTSGTGEATAAPPVPPTATLDNR
jgi:hypothetical protein